MSTKPIFVLSANTPLQTSQKTLLPAFSIAILFSCSLFSYMTLRVTSLLNQLHREMELLETVQCRATKMVNGVLL